MTLDIVCVDANFVVSLVSSEPPNSHVEDLWNQRTARSRILDCGAAVSTSCASNFTLGISSSLNRRSQI
jgi:hypothetical protein